LINIIINKFISDRFINQNLKLYIHIFCLYFLISFCSKVVKNLKESVLLTIPNGDAILLPSIKLYLSLPVAFLSIAFFNWLSNRYSQKTVFTLMLSLICGWFLVFGFFIYPNYEELALVQTGNFLNAYMPIIFAPFAQLITYWGPSLFYIVADLLPNLIISLLLWSFISDITTPVQGARLFPLLGLDLPGISAGFFCTYMASQSFDIWTLSGWHGSFALAILLVCAALGIALVLFWYLPNHQSNSGHPLESPTQKFSLRQNLMTVKNNPILFYMTFALFIFEMTSGLINIVWKDIVLKFYPDPEGYSSFMGFSAMITGITGVLFTLFVVPKLLRVQRSSVNLLMTPILLLASNTIFFGVILFYGKITNSILFDLSVIILGVGIIHTALTQILKFAFFDPLKELSLQLLGPQCRRQGKSIADVIGNRCGKAACPLSYQSLIALGFSTTTIGAPIAVITGLLLSAWLASSVVMYKNQKEGILT
jgi:ATP:ADP antiporter, AAA family